MKWPRWVYHLLNVHSASAHAAGGMDCPACGPIPGWDGDAVRRSMERPGGER